MKVFCSDAYETQVFVQWVKVATKRGNLNKGYPPELPTGSSTLLARVPTPMLFPYEDVQCTSTVRKLYLYPCTTYYLLTVNHTLCYVLQSRKLLHTTYRIVGDEMMRTYSTYV